MNIPKLAKKPITKSCHEISWKDDYAWIHQDNILEVLKDGSKLLPEVRKYLEDENNFTEKSLSDTKSLQKKLFKEIKGRVKLDDESLPFKDKKYQYWTRVTKEGNYSKLNDKTRDRLVDFFRPHNLQFYDLVGKNLDWEK